MDRQQYTAKKFKRILEWSIKGNKFHRKATILFKTSIVALLRS